MAESRGRLLGVVFACAVGVVVVSRAQPSAGPIQPSPVQPSPVQPSTPTKDPEVPFEEFPSTFELTRKDKKILAVKYGPNPSETTKGLFSICSPKDEDKDRCTKVVILDELPYLVHITIGKNIIKAPLVFIGKQEGGDGSLEAYNGTASELPDICLPQLKADPKSNTVFVEQGKTKLSGSRLDYSEETGLAVIAGPITFERPQDKDKLTGVSEKITVNVDAEKTFLEGKVTLNSKCRISKADKVEYDDRANRAVLEGKPAISIQTDAAGRQIGEVRGEYLEYNLETNDVVVLTKGFKGSVENPVASFVDDAKGCS